MMPSVDHIQTSESYRHLRRLPVSSAARHYLRLLLSNHSPMYRPLHPFRYLSKCHKNVEQMEAVIWEEWGRGSHVRLKIATITGAAFPNIYLSREASTCRQRSKQSKDKSKPRSNSQSATGKNNNRRIGETMPFSPEPFNPSLTYQGHPFTTLAVGLELLFRSSATRGATSYSSANSRSRPLVKREFRAARSSPPSLRARSLVSLMRFRSCAPSAQQVAILTRTTGGTLNFCSHRSAVDQPLRIL
jgi:hypothetical protein